MLCVIYARVSTEDQARHGYSLGAQVRECQERARALGYSEGQQVILVDEGYSGDAVDRPGLNRLRDLVGAPGQVGHVVILDPDRFARSLSLQLIVTEEIIRGGAQLEFLNFDWQDTAEGKLFYSLRGAIAEYEKAKIRERTRRGREQKARQGLLPVGKSLYGFRFDPVSDTLEPVPEEQAVLRLIRDLMLGGERLSATQTAKRLAERGVPAPKGGRWYASTVARMVRNPAYTGGYPVLGGRYTVSIPPVWDEATHKALCQHLAENRFRAGPAAGAGYLLSGLLRCGSCGRLMVGHRVRDQRRNYRYYLCGRAPAFEVETGRRVRCGERRHWPAHLLEEAVWGAVVGLVRSSCLPAVGDGREAERAALEGALAKRRGEYDRYLRLYAAGHIADEGRLEALVAPVRTAIAQLSERLTQLGEGAPVLPPVGEVGRLGPAGRRRLVHLLVPKAVIGREGLLLYVMPPRA